jgi:hypothetical protein
MDNQRIEPGPEMNFSAGFNLDDLLNTLESSKSIENREPLESWQ